MENVSIDFGRLGIEEEKFFDSFKRELECVYFFKTIVSLKVFLMVKGSGRQICAQWDSDPEFCVA